MMRGIHPDTAREIEWRRGALPPGQLGWRKASEVREIAMNLAIAALTHRQVEPQGLRRRRRAARWPPADRHRHPGLRRPAGRGRLLPARRQAPARVLGPAAGAGGRPPRPQLDRADHRPRPARHPGRPAAARARPSTSRSPCSPTSSSSTTRAAGRRSRCRSRRRSPGPRPRFMGQDPKPEALEEVAVQPVPRRGRRRRPRARLGRARRPRRPHRAARAGGAAVVPPAGAASGGRCETRSRPDPSTCTPRCPPGRRRPCSRPAPAPARPTRSPPWSPATSPRARRCSTTCC